MLTRVAFQKKYGERLTFTPLFVEAVAKAIKDFPNINASVDGTTIIVKEDIHIGMATALPSGNLIVPVVKDADNKTLVELAADVNGLTEKARKTTYRQMISKVAPLRFPTLEPLEVSWGLPLLISRK